jgi:hypothetical protein
MRAMLFAMKAVIELPFSNITSDDLLVVLDSGCSITIMPDLGNFIDGTYQPQQHNIRGIDSGLNSSGIGNVDWKFHDVNGKLVTIWLTCLHVPDIPCRLLSLQQVASQGTSKLPEGAWIGRGKSAKVVSNGHVINFDYDPNSNLPSCKMAPGSNHYCSFIAKATGLAPATLQPMTASKGPSILIEHHDNCSSSQKTLLGHENAVSIYPSSRLVNAPFQCVLLAPLA